MCSNLLFKVTPSNNSNPSDVYGDVIQDGLDLYQPTLGPTWHHCVSTRITIRIVHRNYDNINNEASHPNIQHSNATTDDGTIIRCLSIVKCPIAPMSSVNVIISSKGIVSSDYRLWRIRWCWSRLSLSHRFSITLSFLSIAFYSNVSDRW